MPKTLWLPNDARWLSFGKGLCGTQGILVRRKNHCRLVISLDAIMRSVSLEIDEADVLPVF